MRILEVRFKNLNSLMGEWKVDFTHPAYTSDGIFAITGPTGSGKTTLLDAICLALYGRTPRLSSITATSNEIMTRQSGECFAEVVFETRAGRFCCHWSQHRARKKPDGNLQNARHEISNAKTGEVLEAKIRDVAARVEEVSGMDFDRFTRSMLLAQGDFAAFLQAPPDARAPILEQITGTEIYSQISIKVHEHRTAERRKLESLQAELAGTQLLTVEQEQALNSILQEKLCLQDELAKQCEWLRKARGWLEGITALEKEIAVLEEQWQHFEERQEAFQPDLERLNRARKAIVVEGDYIRVSELRNQQNQEREELVKARKHLPGWETAQAEALQTWQTAVDQQKQARVTQNLEAETIKQVREIDFRIADKLQRIEKLAELIELLKHQHQECCKHIGEREEALKAAQAALSEVELYLGQNAVDAGLVTNLKVLNKMFDTLHSLDTQCTAADKKLADASRIKTLSTAASAELTLAYKKSQAELTQLEQEYQHLDMEIMDLLKGQELSAWRDQLDALKERKGLLEVTEQTLERIHVTRQNLDELKTRRHALVKEQLRLVGEINFYTERKTDQEREVEHLETRVALLNRIRDLEAERARLEDGQPCPLCGAIEHPYAKGNLPVLDEAEAALQSAKKELKDISELLAKLKIHEATTTRDLEQNGEDVEKQKALLEAEEKRSAEVWLKLQITASPGERLAKVANEKAIVQSRIIEGASHIMEVEQKAKKEKVLLQALEKARKAYAEADKALQNAEHKREFAERDYDRLDKEYAALKEQFADARREVLKEVAIYGINDLPEKLNSLLGHFTQRCGQWQTKLIEKSDHEKNITDLKLELEKQRVLRDKLDEELEARQQEQAEWRSQLEVLRRERFVLYGDKNPDIEEKQRADEVERAEKELEQAQMDHDKIEREVNYIKVRIDSLNDSIQRRTEVLSRAEQELTAHLKRAGFEDEDAYRTSWLAEEERDQLTEKVNALNQEKTELQTRRQDKHTTLQAERKKAITDEPYDTVQQKLAAYESSLKETQQEIGAIKRDLDNNEDLRIKQQQRLADIELQKKECTRWDMLHELIGSADGKKYRNFAQGLTFEMMVAHANRRLQKMTDRYLLLRDHTQPLDLNVIDNYQAGEIRSTKNLSGGESFIVSLALALGLSQMASRNVRVDSLFLDEGFGTLDEDALDTALDTLAGLQQDGKLIGVISHVAALKERISTQIQVIPETSGRSIISGPGCQRI